MVKISYLLYFQDRKSDKKERHSHSSSRHPHIKTERVSPERIIKREKESPVRDHRHRYEDRHSHRHREDRDRFVECVIFFLLQIAFV